MFRPSPGDVHNPGIKSMSPALAGGFFTTEPLGKPIHFVTNGKRIGVDWKEE